LNGRPAPYEEVYGALIYSIRLRSEPLNAKSSPDNTMLILEAGVTETALRLLIVAAALSVKVHAIELGTIASPSSSKKSTITIYVDFSFAFLVKIIGTCSYRSFVLPSALINIPLADALIEVTLTFPSKCEYKL
jgi:hypothetical protein